MNLSQIDISSAHLDFMQDKRVRLARFLREDSAAILHSLCKTKTPYQTNYVLENEYKILTEDDIANLSALQQAEMTNSVIEQASQGVGFIYQSYMNSKINAANVYKDKTLAPLHDAFEFMSSDDIISIFREITGDNTITGCDSHFTRFLPGHFLTRHQDEVSTKKRKYAFVLSLTEHWHPDWGGLLQFYEKNGTPRDSWSPAFNTLSLFDISYIHSVTFITPFAKQPRLSLTGWFTSD